MCAADIRSCFAAIPPLFLPKIVCVGLLRSFVGMLTLTLALGSTQDIITLFSPCLPAMSIVRQFVWVITPSRWVEKIEHFPKRILCRHHPRPGNVVIPPGTIDSYMLWLFERSLPFSIQEEMRDDLRRSLLEQVGARKRIKRRTESQRCVSKGGRLEYVTPTPTPSPALADT